MPPARNVLRLIAAAGGAAIGIIALAASPSSATPYTFIVPGFTAKVVAQNPGFLGGVAFAADGDILSDSCAFGGSPLIRWDVQGGTSNIGGSTVFTSRTDQPSNAGCGLTTHSNGFIYTNTGAGVVKLTDTGTQIGDAVGDSGNALGISEDPVTGNLFWVSGDGSIKSMDPDTNTDLGFFANNGGFTDGIFWDPAGDFLFTTDRSAFSVDVFDRNGNLIVSVPLGHEPDGIAFSTEGFVLTNNIDGTITKIVFNDLNDLSLGGVVSIFASGGFRGDLSHVGPDGCWYVTQDGTRFEDGTTDGDNSIVQICAANGGGFEPPPGTDPGPGPGPIPEPATLGLLGFGLLGSALVARRRRNSAD